MRVFFIWLVCVAPLLSASAPTDTDIADGLIAHEPSVEDEPHTKILPRVRELQKDWFRQGRTTEAAWRIRGWCNIREQIRSNPNPHPLAIHFAAVHLGLADAKIDKRHRLGDLIGRLRVPEEEFEGKLVKLAAFSLDDLNRDVVRSLVVRAQLNLSDDLRIFNAYGRRYQAYLPFLVRLFTAVNDALRQIGRLPPSGNDLDRIKSLEDVRSEIRTRLEVLVPVASEQLRLSSEDPHRLTKTGLDLDFEEHYPDHAKLLRFLEKYHNDRETAEIGCCGRCCYHRSLTDRRLNAVRGFNIIAKNWHDKNGGLGTGRLRAGDLFLLIKILCEDSKKMRLAINHRISCFLGTRCCCGSIANVPGCCSGCLSECIGAVAELAAEKFLEGVNGVVAMAVSAGDLGGARLAVRHKRGDFEKHVLGDDVYPEPQLYGLWSKESAKRRQVLRDRAEARRVAVGNLKAHNIYNAVYNDHSDEEPMVERESPVVGRLEFRDGSDSDG